MEFGLSDERMQRAIRLTNTAVLKDFAGEVAEACLLYTQAAESWKLICKCGCFVGQDVSLQLISV